MWSLLLWGCGVGPFVWQPSKFIKKLLPMQPEFLWITAGLLMSYGCDIASSAGGDCMEGRRIDCFECNTWDDPRCHDPWNWTFPLSTMPPVKDCYGCCVKMVQFIGTPHYQIKRTCTDNFEVNFFMVNHACMIEGHRHGHMCFCEDSQCNTGDKSGKSVAVMVFAQIFLSWTFLSSTRLSGTSG